MLCLSATHFWWSKFPFPWCSYICCSTLGILAYPPFTQTTLTWCFTIRHWIFHIQRRRNRFRCRYNLYKCWWLVFNSFSEALCILLEFYSSQDVQVTFPYLSSMTSVCSFRQLLLLLQSCSQVLPPTLTTRPQLYNAAPQSVPLTHATDTTLDALGWTPHSPHGGNTPSGSPQNAKKNSRSEMRRLDLSWELWIRAVQISHDTRVYFPIINDVLMAHANQSPRRKLCGSSASTTGPIDVNLASGSCVVWPFKCASIVQFLMSADDHDKRSSRPASDDASDKVLRTPAEEPKSVEWYSVSWLIAMHFNLLSLFPSQFDSELAGAGMLVATCEMATGSM